MLEKVKEFLWNNFTKNRLTWKERKKIKENVKKELDEMYESIVKPYFNEITNNVINGGIGNSSVDNFKISMLSSILDDDEENDSDHLVIYDKLAKNKNNYYKKLQKNAKKWVKENYSDVFEKEETYSHIGSNFNYVKNKNLDINTGETGFMASNLEFFEKLVSKDTHIHGAVWSIINSVTSRKWEIIPSKKSKKANKIADFVETTINNLPDFTEVLENLSYSIVTGVTFQEIIYDNVNGNLIPVDIVYRKPHYFKFDYNGNLYYEYASEKVALPKEKFLIHAYKGNATKRYGESIIGERIFWMYYFKRMIWRFRLRFLERFGNPLVVHKFQTEEERIKMNEALKYMASKGAIQVPEGSEILLSEAMGDTADFRHAIDDLNKEIEISIVGQTSTMMRENGGSYASDYIRQDQFYNKVGALLQSIENVINNYLIKPMVLLNFPREKDFPKISFNKTDDALKIKEIERDLSLVRQQMPVNISQLFRKIGLNTPDDMDEKLTTAPYYDEFGNVKGGLPPEIRHQVRREINDPRLEDIGVTGEGETPVYDDKNIDDPNDPDYQKRKNEEEERKRIAENRQKRQGRPPDGKGGQDYASGNKKSGKLSNLFDIDFLEDLKKEIKDKNLKNKLNYRIKKLKKLEYK